MYTIYKIVNNINNKIYIGLTSNSIEQRFHQHINRSNQKEEKHRPLYYAFNKYGIENFSIEEIETNIQTKEEANLKEQYWIKKLNSFGQNGYNATIGGDCGSSFKKAVVQINPDTLTIVNSFESTHEAARFLNKDNAHISDACLKKRKSAYNFLWAFKDDIKEDTDLKKFFNLKPKVLQINKQTNEIIASFKSCYQAGKKLNINPSHIQRVCNGERKTTGGFKWKYQGQ